MNFIARLLLVTLTILVVATYVPGIHVEGFYAALLAAVVLGLLNVLVKPILTILTFPITVITLGLFSFVINAVIFWWVGSILDGFVVDGFVAAFIGSLIVSAVSVVGNKIFS